MLFITVTLQNSLLHSSHEDGLLGHLLGEVFEKLPLGEEITEFLTHFVVDSINIFLLLFVVMFCVFFLQTYINGDKLRDKMAQLRSIWGYLLAVIMGIISPFCSCSIVPVLMGLIAVGVPIPVCLCVLTTASLINITAVTAMYTLTGFAYGTVYLISSVVIIVVSSVILSLVPLKDAAKECGLVHDHHHERIQVNTIPERARLALSSVGPVFKSAWFFILLGVTISAGMEAFFHIDEMAEIVNDNVVLSTIIAALIGFPIHSDVFTIMPILRLLKDIYPPVAMTFTLATMVISIPGVVILSRVLKQRVIAIYVGVLVVLTLSVGFVLIPIL